MSCDISHEGLYNVVINAAHKGVHIDINKKQQIYLTNY